MGHLEEFSRWPAKRFIETGVGEGRTLKAAAQFYPDCISIELHEGRYLAALEIFKDQSNVRIFHGNSPAILRRIIDPKISTVFWLDAHCVPADTDWKSGTISKDHGLCPIIEELEIIKALPWTEKPVILIDDWSTFRQSGAFSWPSLQKLDEVMGAKHVRYPELPGCDVFGYADYPLSPREEAASEVLERVPV